MAVRFVDGNAVVRSRPFQEFDRLRTETARIEKEAGARISTTEQFRLVERHRALHVGAPAIHRTVRSEAPV
ncbi:hypothetical protein AB0O22_06985 [Streptomyces sp. NPDC091204]|uniref:hypothetical protein n=1 Tax=Streptomyces sp. NPDC091204 TaxID=3155299 RepID=UPI00343D784B